MGPTLTPNLTEKVIAILAADFQAKLIAAIITVFFGTLNYLFIRKRARVVWGVSHGFSFSVPQNNGQMLSVTTQTVFVQNIGKETAHKLEIHFNYKPEHFQIWPTFNYTPEFNPEGRYCIHIETLGGNREWLTIELLSTMVLPYILRVRTIEGECKQVQLAPTQIFAKWVRILAGCLVFLGLFFSIYHLALLFG